jgi:demethylmenaquinone methyltransferase/2-methoxy-6-polyprenyl-1,4-benzoquinol methylase
MPELVAAAAGRAGSAGFELSCDPAVGGLLAVLAAHLPAGSRVLELGTGAGVGTAWIASGLLSRTDVTVTTVEGDPDTARLARQGSWPGFVELREGDALDVLREGATFDLIFADAPGGKHEGLGLTIAALNPRGLLIVDDMTPVPQWPAELHARQAEVRRALLASPLLTSVELACGSGVILCARRG